MIYNLNAIFIPMLIFKLFKPPKGNECCLLLFVETPLSQLLGVQKRNSLENPPFQRFLPERKSKILIFWTTICFTTSTMLKRASVDCIAWNTCKFLLRTMAVLNMLDMHLENTVYLVKMEFKQFFSKYTGPNFSRNSYQDLKKKKKKITSWLKNEIRFQN